jgi:hypothetical protein
MGAGLVDRLAGHRDGVSAPIVGIDRLACDAAPQENVSSMPPLFVVHGPSGQVPVTFSSLSVMNAVPLSVECPPRPLIVAW